MGSNPPAMAGDSLMKESGIYYDLGNLYGWPLNAGSAGFAPELQD